MENINAQISALSFNTTEAGITRAEVHRRLPGIAFEYFWPWIFLRRAIDCYSELECVCRLFGDCFDSMKEYKANLEKQSKYV